VLASPPAPARALGLPAPAPELRARWAGVRRVLAVRLDNIGDVVMCGPALRALRAALPQAEITLLASSGGVQAAPMLPWVDGAWALDALWQDVGDRMPFDPARERALVDRLAGGSFDAAVVFTSFSQSPLPAAYACYLAGIPLRAGQAREFGGSVLSPAVAPAPEGAHQVDRNLHLLAGAGLAVASDAALELALPDAARAEADRVLAAHAGLGSGEPFVAVAPGASCPSRRYPPRAFAAAAARVRRVTGLPAVTVGAPRERPVAEAVAGAAPLAGRTSVPGLAAVLDRAALVLTNNSAPMHVADALRRPSVALFAGTELEPQYAPRSGPCRILRRATACAPCRRFDCPYGTPCLDIPAELVAEAGLELLSA
jgi:ADP-heptose:LPS heptosyltransferase